jgi:hypothetical protein
VDEEVKVLGGELRDEWRGRVGAVKADWMAKIIPTSFQDLNESTEVEGEGGWTEGEGEGMKPTIISDVDEREAMVSRVDSGVEVEFEERLKEATERIRSGVERSEELEVDLYLGSLVRSSLSWVACICTDEDVGIVVGSERRDGRRRSDREGDKSWTTRRSRTDRIRRRVLGLAHSYQWPLRRRHRSRGDTTLLEPIAVENE